MRPCLNLTTVLRADLEEAVGAAAQAGFETVELWVDALERYLNTHTVEDLRSLLDGHHMSVLGIGDIESVTFCNPEQFDALRRRCERLASVASAISCPTLVANASVKPREVDISGIASETTSVLGKLLDIVEPAGVGLAFAFRGFGWCAVNSLEQAREAVEFHAGRRIGLALDTFDLHTTGVQPGTLKSVDPSLILVMRLSDCNDAPPLVLSETDRVLPGEGIANLEAMLDALQDAGFSGPVSLKILSPNLWSLGAAEITKVVMAVATQYLPRMRSEEKS
ncbi:MAG: sugar phosphate isomerase/epimerase [Candidatus Hydrogenedentota bacterium]|nr:MAG: sugar phosphate isomerase/epimerase [Candidatus Hydrogenedentota bacterium]